MGMIVNCNFIYSPETVLFSLYDFQKNQFLFMDYYIYILTI